MQEILNEVQVFLDAAQKAGRHYDVVHVAPMDRQEHNGLITLSWSITLSLEPQVGQTGDSQGGFVVSNAEG